MLSLHKNEVPDKDIKPGTYRLKDVLGMYNVERLARLAERGRRGKDGRMIR